jgi:Rieske Fe-S protein
LNRREFIRSLVAASALAATGVVGLTELIATTARSSPPPQQLPSIQATMTQQQAPSSITSQPQTVSTSSLSNDMSPPAGYLLLAPLSSLAGKSYVYFQHPSGGNSILVNFTGAWKAFSATCTHATCTLDYQGSTIYCPCHGGEFNPRNGSVTRGPPPRALPEYSVLTQNGNVYVSK